MSHELLALVIILESRLRKKAFTGINYFWLKPFSKGFDVSIHILRVCLLKPHAKELADLPEGILEDLKNADLIIHAGDYTSKNLLEQLRELSDFKGVHGNMDSDEVKRELPDKAIFEGGGFKIGITHLSEGGSPVGLKSRTK